MNTNRLEALVGKARRLTNRAIRNLVSSLKTIEREKARAVAEAAAPYDQAIKHIHVDLKQLGHEVGNGRPSKAKSTNSAPAAKVRASKKRIRRSPEQLAKYANGAYEFIKAHPGCGGGAIRKAFADIGQDIKGFIDKHSDKKIKTTGKKSKMAYHAA